MDEHTRQIVEGLKQAMLAESDGHNFYMMAAKNTKDNKGKQVLTSLAKDEIDHFNFLKAQYKSFMETGAPDANIKLRKYKSNTSKSPIFSADFKKRLKKAHYEMSALAIGAQLELLSIQFYRGESEKAINPVVKAFYAELAEWETTHHLLLAEFRWLLIIYLSR